MSGSLFCPLCKKLLEHKTKELVATAKEAIFSTTPSISSTGSTVETDIDPDDESSMAETLPSEDSQKCDETKGLHKKIEFLTSSPKPTYHHHRREVLESATLGQPAASSKPQSSSMRRQPLKEIQNTCQTQHQLPVNGFGKQFLPWDICQTNITGRSMASNACTIIASLWCRKFLMKNITISACQHGEFDDITNNYKQAILTGNMLYNSVNLPAHQTNLEVCNVVHRIPDLSLKIQNDVGFFDVEQLRQTFIQMLEDSCRHAGGLIIPPANSVAILIENKQIALFDSHQHGDKGGLVLLSNLGEFDTMLSYLGESQNLGGSNFSEFGLTK